MNTVRVQRGEIAVGRALPWAAYDANGRLLLQAGCIVKSGHQLNALISRGIYRRQDPREAAPSTAPAPTDCPFDLIDGLPNQLERALTAMQRADTNAISAIMRASRQVQNICALDSNVALGEVHLSSESPEPLSHLVLQALLCEVLMRHLQWPEQHRLSVIAATLTSNVAIMDLQRSLSQQDGALTAEQRREIQCHPATGRKMLEQAGATDPVWLDTILYHHERPDGSGYPLGLSGSAVCIEARVTALADIYLAMISRRAYRQEKLASQALREIFIERGKSVDEDMCIAFIKELGVFPPGAFVMLDNGEVGVVVQRGKDGTCPVVSSIISPRGGPYARPLRRTCGKETHAIRGMVARDPSIPINPRLIWGYA